jgi:hypothetical protein
VGANKLFANTKICIVGKYKDWNFHNEATGNYQLLERESTKCNDYRGEILFVFIMMTSCTVNTNKKKTMAVGEALVPATYSYSQALKT